MDPSGHAAIPCPEKDAAIQSLMDQGLSKRKAKNRYEQLRKTGLSPSDVLDHVTGKSNAPIYLDAYGYMKSKVNGQAHHLNQDAAFKGVIPKNSGLCIELDGNAFIDIDSGHYKAHKSMEKFWDQYRKGGSKHGQYVSIADYNKALYNSLVDAGVPKQKALYAVRRAYEQQKYYGLKNNSYVPNIPGKINQRKG